MKKLLCFITAVCLMFVLASCTYGNNTAEVDSTEAITTATTVTTEVDSTETITTATTATTIETYYPDSPNIEDPFVLGPNTLPPSSEIWRSVWFELHNADSDRLYFTRSELESITSITIGGDMGEGVQRGLTGIEMLVNLESITFTGIISRNHFRRLNRLPNLHTLRFTEYAAMKQNLLDIGHLSNLTRNLRRLEIIGDEGVNAIISLAGIQNFRNLERLEIPGNRAFVGGDTGGRPELERPLCLAPLERLTNIRVLDISGNGLEDLNAIRRLRNITHLNASNNELTDTTSIREMWNLRRVNLSHNRLTGLSGLGSRVSLTTQSPNRFGNDFSFNYLSEEELLMSLPRRLRETDNGEWLQRQIESQNTD